MNYRLEHRDILYNNDQLGPYPDHLLKRVDQITSVFVGTPKRKSHHDTMNEYIKKGLKGPELAARVAKVEAKPVSTDGRPAPPTQKPEPLSAAFTEVRAHARTIRETPNPVAKEKAPIPEDPRVLSRHLKAVAYFMGADAVGICEVPEYGYYTDDIKDNPIGCDYKYAIVLAKRKHLETSLASTGRDRIYDACSHQTYQLLGQWTETLANYIRRLGYEALASNSRNYVTVMPALILAAGLGENCRLGIACNPFFGPNFKACCTLTNLPLEPDKPIDFGLQEYCDKCQMCCSTCSSGAFPRSNEKIEYNGYLKWPMKYEQCVLYEAVNPFGSACGRCAMLCPWNHPGGPEYFRDWDGSTEWLHRKTDEWAEYLREHKYVMPDADRRQWWLDLKLENGKLVIPDKAKYEPLPDNPDWEKRLREVTRD